MSVPFYVIYKDFRCLGGYGVQKCISKQDAIEFIHASMQKIEETGNMPDTADYTLIEGYRYEVYNELKVRSYKPLAEVKYYGD